MSDAILRQATALHQSGRTEEAERLYRAVLAENPAQPDALALLGLLRGEQRDFAEAVRLLEQAVIRDPATPLFRFYLGNVLGGSGAYAGAVEAYREAVTRKPDFAEAWVALSDNALKVKDYEQALQAAAEAVRLMPDNLPACIAQGLALDYLNREDEAVACFERATRLRPGFLPAWDMLGTTLQNLNRLDEAGRVMRHALALAGGVVEAAEEDYVIQHWNLALYELLRGDFRNGFAHYRARFKNPGRAPRLNFPQPLWRGEDPAGKKILLVGEQGFGDVLMLCRYAPLLKARGAKTVLLVHEALVSLLRQSDLADEIICQAPQSQGDYDYQASLFDLPHRFGTAPDTIPAPVPYLPLPAPDDATRLPATGRLKVGVVWSGRSDYGNDRRRSLPLAVFARLFGNTEVDFFSLTRELKPGDAEILARCNVADLSPRLKDFMATAQFASQMDLIISCDTGVAHLAGGMGKPVWVLLPFAPDWRWRTEREDSAWYPGMRLFRQQARGDWAETVARVGHALELLCRASLGLEKRT